jgi:NAD(P)-dependent dehydrogenase (short-subunit alcohol dehydrogenase family)
VFNAVKESYDLLKEGNSSIVNIGSVHAYATSRNISAYAASKGALLAFTRALALEFIDDGIRVNCVVPGAVNTNMLVEGLTRANDGFETTQVMLDRLGLRHPIKRVGEPAEIANLIYFLTDNTQSAYITGQSFVIDGGALTQLSTEIY